MGLPRFLVDRLDEQGLVQLSEAESHHGARVLRLGMGDPCVVFDGQGYEARGQIESLSKKSIQVSYAARRFSPRDHEGRLHFAIGMPKGDRQRNVIEKLIELGVDRLTPIETQRSVSKLDSSGIERLGRYGIEACKQSQRNRLMRIDPYCDWQSWLQTMQGDSRCDGWILHPAGVSEGPFDAAKFIAERIPDSVVNQDKRIVFAIGPEGGFTEQEVQRSLEVGFKLLDLGERILRVETAVGVAAVLGSLRLSGSLLNH